jgi:hypothetical protein
MLKGEPTGLCNAEMRCVFLERKKAPHIHRLDLFFTHVMKFLFYLFMV